MSESKKDALRVNFDRKLKLEFHGVKVTSDAGLLAYREIDDVFGLTDMATYELTDNRTGKNTQHSEIMKHGSRKRVISLWPEVEQARNTVEGTDKQYNDRIF